MNSINAAFDAINNGVTALFSLHNIALWLALALLIWCGVIIAFNFVRYYRPFNLQVDARLRVTDPIGGAANDEEAQSLFASNFESIDDVMTEGAKESELRHAWTQFKETIVDFNDVPLRATTRPEGYFLHLGDDTRVLAWWANIFVAFGLTFTFLGIVAALHKTVAIMAPGAAQTDMLAALTGLLNITAAKFWTSIGGVLASIILRMVDRRWHSAMDRKLERLCDRLEYGTLFSPPQRIAADQLRELKQQTVALTEFSHQLAASIGDALGHHMAPVVAGLGGIQSSLDDFSKGSFNQIGKELGEAISRNAGTEMESLAAALTGMTVGLQSVTEKLDGESGKASAQIEAAAQQFATAADQMQGAFGLLKSNIEEMTQKLTGSASEAAEQNAKVLEGAALMLSSAAKSVADDMKDTVGNAIKDVAGRSGEALSDAFAQFDGRFQAAGSDLVNTLSKTTVEANALAGAMERSTVATTSHAGKLDDASSATERVATTLRSAANDVSAAANPIRDAATAIRDSVGQSQELLRRTAERSDQQHAAIEAAAGSLERTGVAATQAWEGYRTRFADVDEALAKALSQIASASTEHASALNTQVGRIDAALGAAVERLAGALDDIKDLAEALEDLHGRQQAAN